MLNLFPVYKKSRQATPKILPWFIGFHESRILVRCGAYIVRLYSAGNARRTW